MTFLQGVAEVRLPKHLVTRHLTLLNVEHTRVVYINGGGVLPLHLLFLKYTSSFSSFSLLCLHNS